MSSKFDNEFVGTQVPYASPVIDVIVVPKHSVEYLRGKVWLEPFTPLIFHHCYIPIDNHQYEVLPYAPLHNTNEVVLLSFTQTEFVYSTLFWLLACCV